MIGLAALRHGEPFAAVRSAAPLVEKSGALSVSRRRRHPLPPLPPAADVSPLPPCATRQVTWRGQARPPDLVRPASSRRGVGGLPRRRAHTAAAHTAAAHRRLRPIQSGPHGLTLRNETGGREACCIPQKGRGDSTRCLGVHFPLQRQRCGHHFGGVLRQRCVAREKQGGPGRGGGAESRRFQRAECGGWRGGIFLPSAAIVASPLPGGPVRRPQRRQEDWDGAGRPGARGLGEEGRAPAAAQVVLGGGAHALARAPPSPRRPRAEPVGQRHSGHAPPPLRALPLPHPLCTKERQARLPRPDPPCTATTPPAPLQPTVSLPTILGRSSRPHPPPFLRPPLLLFLFLTGSITATPSTHNAVASLRVGVCGLVSPFSPTRPPCS